MDNDNGMFTTHDLTLATWLKASGLWLEMITPVDDRKCAFKFKDSSELRDLVDQWNTDSPVADVRNVVATYRHLIRDARATIRGRVGWGSTEGRGANHD